MNLAEYGSFLTAMAIACVAGALLNLFRLKSRGNSAFILSAAFLTFGVVLWLIREKADSNALTIAVIVLVALLIIDLVVRSKALREKDSR